MSNERPWLDNYPAGVPAQIDIDQYASVPAMLEETFAQFRDHPAFANFGHRLSYGQIDTLSRQFAGYLTGVLKLVKGDRVAIMLPNVLQYPVALFGAMRAGMIVVNTNKRYYDALYQSAAPFVLEAPGRSATLMISGRF